MIIRHETPEDYRAAELLTRDAFWNVYRPGCTEHYVLHRYRENPDFIPELDFVLEENGRLIGHVMFSKAELVLDDGTRKPSWTFGPIGIHPAFKRKGYGLKLLNFALDKAREMGVGFLCMEGNIAFYKHAGFRLASEYNIRYHGMPPGEEVPFFLAQELIPGWLQANGIEEATYCPPEGYFVADAGPWRDDDAPVLFKWASDPDIGSRAGWPPHRSVEESLEVIRTVFRDATYTWAVELKETGEAIGAMGYGPSCNCDLPAREGEPIVGYWIAKPYWNRGLCTEALGLLLEHIRLTTGVKSLIGGHFVDNPASGRVMEKCGFVPTGETAVDEAMYLGKDHPIRVLRKEM